VCMHTGCCRRCPVHAVPPTLLIQYSLSCRKGVSLGVTRQRLALRGLTTVTTTRWGAHTLSLVDAPGTDSSPPLPAFKQLCIIYACCHLPPTMQATQTSQPPPTSQHTEHPQHRHPPAPRAAATRLMWPTRGPQDWSLPPPASVATRQGLAHSWWPAMMAHHTGALTPSTRARTQT
jgi:hypothetical protein